MTELERLRKDIQELKTRNKRVELNKAWETSRTRRVLLAVFTYLAIGFYFQAIKIEKAWLNAIVPSIAFLLSTLTLPFFKKIWEKYIHKR